MVQLIPGERGAVGWNRFAEGFFPQDSNFNPASIGLDTGVSSFDYGLAEDFGRRASPSSAPPPGVPRQRVDTNWHFIDNYSWKIGRHDLKFGYEFRRTSIHITQNSQLPRQAQLRRSDEFLEGFASGGSQAAGYTQRHEYRKQPGLLRSGQLPLDVAADREPRPALGLLWCAGREE